MIFNIVVIVPFLIALFFWIRGLWKQCISDVIVSSITLCVAIGAYFYAYQYISFVGIPWSFLLISATGGGVVVAIKRKEGIGKAYALAPIIAVCLSGVLFLGEQKWNASENSLLVLTPYRAAGTWVFDDPRAGLKAEPFISGIPEIIDELIAEAKVADADKGFRMIFSSQPFPNHQSKITWVRPESGGNWYYSEEYKLEGWLCPALFKYFRRAPRTIYVKAEGIKDS